MQKKIFFGMAVLGIAGILLLVSIGKPVWSQEITFTTTQKTNYFQKDTALLNDGKILEKTIVNGPPSPPPGIERTTISTAIKPEITAGLNVLTVPAFTWSFGCSATSAAMIAGYYDRTTYPDMYTGPTDGGVMPLDNSSWPDWVDSAGDIRHQCPLSATHQGLDGRTIAGHVDDYWIEYGAQGPDPYEGNWTEHVAGDAVGDFMKTNKWFSSEGYNTDGSTVFYNYPDGTPLTAADMENYGIQQYDGGYGLKLFYESRGYTVDEMYNQYIYGYLGNINGFTYDQYKAEIDAGRPVLFHVEGHSMVGVGYDDSTSNLMYIHDTWDYNTHTMEWGGSYAGMPQYAVTIIHLTPNSLSNNLEFYITPPPITSVSQGGRIGPIDIVHTNNTNSVVEFSVQYYIILPDGHTLNSNSHLLTISAQETQNPQLYLSVPYRSQIGTHTFGIKINYTDSAFMDDEDSFEYTVTPNALKIPQAVSSKNESKNKWELFQTK